MSEGAGDDSGRPTGVKPGEQPDPASRRKATLGDLFAELKRRRVFRVMVGYGIFVLAVLQVVEPLMHGLHLPEWVLTAVIAALGVGFPVALVLAWLFDLTAQGVTRTSSSAGAGGFHFSRSRLAGLLVVVGFVGALPGVAWYAWKHASERRGPEASPGTVPSIAVLPFADMSPGKDQEYFADGVAEEIRNALSVVDGLRVIGRSSSAAFKGKADDLGAIGQKLGVAHVLEGSLRKDLEDIRVTAQLVRVSDGTQLWSGSYDRTLAGIFRVQGEIATAVVAALKVKLLAGASVAAEPGGTGDVEAYRLFLVGRSNLIQSRPEGNRKAIAAFERAIERDPGMGAAHALLSFACWNLGLTSPPEDRPALEERSKAAAERAVAVAPDLSLAYAARGSVRMNYDWDWKGARQDLERAVALEPRNPTVLNSLAILESAQGRSREAVDLERRAVDVDPLNGVHLSNFALFLVAAGQPGEARIQALRALDVASDSIFAWYALGLADLIGGNPGAAIEDFGRVSGADRLSGIAAAAHSAGRDAESRDSLAELERLHGDEPFHIAVAHAWRGDADTAFRWLEKAYRVRDPRMRSIKRNALLRPVRGDPRLAVLLRKMNLPVD